MSIATRDQLAPFVDWRSTFLPNLDWQQGEHVSLIGPTGLGKSTLAMELLPFRRFVVVMATKPKDSTLDRLTRKRRRPQYRLVRSFSDRPPTKFAPRLVLWPHFDRLDQLGDQAAVMAEALDLVFQEGAWCVYVDELAYFCRQLGLAHDLELIWQQGRSLGVSLVGATQRPAWVPLELYSQATHVFIFRHNDRRDLDRLGGIAAAGDVDPVTIRELVRGLRRHQFLYVNTRTGQLARSVVT